MICKEIKIVIVEPFKIIYNPRTVNINICVIKFTAMTIHLSMSSPIIQTKIDPKPKHCSNEYPEVVITLINRPGVTGAVL